MIRRVLRGDRLRARSIRLFCCAAAALAVSGLGAPRVVQAANPGDTGLAFLKIGVGARAAAMGEAYVAVAQDPTALYWNPAGISVAPELEVHASHNEWISDVRYEFLGAVRGMRGHAFGGYFSLLHMGELQGRDALGNPTGTFRAYDMAAGATYARRVFRSVEVGVTGKFLMESIQDYSASGYAVDLGMRYRTPVRGLTVAATATNIGTSMKFEQDSFVLPAAARLGAAWRTRRLLEGVILAADLRFPNDNDAQGHVGGEIQVHEYVALRAGAKLNYDEEMGSFGFGVNYREYVIDYAFTPFTESSELGNVHRVSIGWRP